MKRILMISILAITVLVVAGAMAGVAFTAYVRSSTAQSQGPQGMLPRNQGLQAPVQNPGPGGEVIAVDAGRLMLRTPDGETLEVQVTGETRVRLAGSNQPGAMSAIRVGSLVRVVGRPNQAGAILAEAIVVLPEGGLQPGGLQPGGQGAPDQQAAPTGKVSALSPGSLTLQTPEGQEVLVSLTEATRIEMVESGAPGSLDDIQVGERVRVQLRPGQAEALEAQRVLVLPEGDEAGGEVLAVEGSRITLKNPRGQVIILVNQETRFRNGPGAQNTASLAEIAQGKFLVAYGNFREDGVLVARLVMIVNGPRPGAPLPGQ